MKVLMLHNRYLIAGGEDQSTLAEAALLREHGCQVELVEEDNRRVEQLSRGRTAFRTLWSRESFDRVEGLLRQGGFDVLHVQNFFPLWSPSVYYAAARCHVPVVQTLRNYRLLCVNSYLFRDNHVCEDCLGRALPWSGIRHACYRGSTAGSAVVASMIGLHKLMGTWNHKVQTYIALTEFARDKYIAGGLPAEKIAVKPNFVHPAPQPGCGGGEYALFVGRLSREKGIATMLEAWATARASLPLKIAGDGPCVEEVKAAAEHSEHIEYLGQRSPGEVLDLMRQAEFLIFPSEWYEGMPRTVIEAFAVGTPVVASKIGATASMVTDGETGFHFPPGNVAALRSRLEWCAGNLEQLRKLRNNARNTFEATYAGPANAEMLLSIYRDAQQRVLPVAAAKSRRAIP
jgi:glycosyltransferase involved in cell wall biosynthesis